MNKRLYVVLCLVLFSLFIQVVYAGEGEIDLANFPNALADQLNIPLFAGQLLASSIFVALFMFPTVIWTKNPLAILVVGFPVLAFCVAMAWMPVWIFLIICVITALLFASDMRQWITGGGR